MRARASSNWRWNASQSTLAEVYVTLDWLGTVAVTASPHSCLDRFQRDRMGTREPGHQLLDFLLGDDERWRTATRSPFTPSAWPTLGHTTSPAPWAASVNASTNFAARGNGARVALSSTNSTPAT